MFGAISWLLMMLVMIIATVELPLSYQYSSILIGESPAPPESELENMAIRLRKWDVASETCFWTSLFCVKLSFMFLYKIAFCPRNKYNRVWSWSLIYIVLCYGTCLIGVYGQCGDAINLFSYGSFNCTNLFCLKLFVLTELPTRGVYNALCCIASVEASMGRLFLQCHLWYCWLVPRAMILWGFEPNKTTSCWYF